MTAVLSPHPVPCRNCGAILQATYAEENDFACPNCGKDVCYTCGCVEASACSVKVSNRDETSAVVLVCAWAAMGICTFCFWRMAYEFYQEVVGLPADDPFYMSIGRTVRGVKGLGYGI
jgi:predicted RNA-binding Zn-ribbon protein involved in translation (DUF1610 family)